MSCIIEGCLRPVLVKKRGLCNAHYRRWRRHGDPEAGGENQYQSPEESFEARTMPVTETACLIWVGSLRDGGYGQIRYKGTSYRAHRYAWERVNGTIPEGIFLDHICYVRSCVNVDHLRLASNAQNGANREGPPSDNTSGFRNVSWASREKMWRVTVKGLHFGYFHDKDQAVEKAVRARNLVLGKFSGRG